MIVGIIFATYLVVGSFHTIPWWIAFPIVFGCLVPTLYFFIGAVQTK